MAVFTATAPRSAAGESQLRALEDALTPEVGGALPGARITVKRRQAPPSVEIRIEADTVKSLRAAVNSYLRAAALALDVAAAASDD